MIELAEARDLMKEILLSAPNTQFTDIKQCVYFGPGGEPVCAVGYFFDRIGIRYGDLRGTMPYYNTNTTRVYGLKPTWDDKFGNDVAQFLWRVQDEQDQGSPWGKVYETIFGEAEEDAEDHG
jgi:hypothetical protein